VLEPQVVPDLVGSAAFQQYAPGVPLSAHTFFSHAVTVIWAFAQSASLEHVELAQVCVLKAQNCPVAQSPSSTHPEHPVEPEYMSSLLPILQHVTAPENISELLE
jgi:hypothetical protein